MTVAYFAEPIDADRPTTSNKSIRNRMMDILDRYGMAIYRPASAWSGREGTREEARNVESVNRDALMRADLMVVHWPKSILSVGVPMEIEFAANTREIPVILWSDRDDSVSIAANPNIRRVVNEFEFENALANWDRFAKPWLDRGEPRIDMRFSGPDGAMNRAHPGDAGFDLIVTEDTKIPYAGTARVPCGTAVELPPGVFGWVVARSSTFDRYQVTILPGIIDTDFRGELFAVALNESTVDHVWIKAGSRIAQLVLLPNVAMGVYPKRVDAVSTDTPRGANGFGSTGV